LLDIIEGIPAALDFCGVLKEKREQNKMAFIAEIKKTSPSKGVIRENFNPVEIAKTYETFGVSAISILTEDRFFQGKNEYLTDVRKICKLPLLRKDFIIDEFQVYETRSLGADIILLIAAVLDDKQLKDFYYLSRELGLNVLLEVHNEEELERALATGARIIGINNRNLKTFEVSLQNTLRLVEKYKLTDKCVISESGIHSRSDIELLQTHGIAGVLIGEAIMKETNVENALSNLLY
jgi:indole-3-glycerol phosphate synthase